MLSPMNQTLFAAVALSAQLVTPATLAPLPQDPILWSILLAAAVNSTLVAGENLTVGSTVWLPAESVAPGR
jgi:hypothetical protein